MYKLKLFLLPVALLLAFMALACAPPDDDDRSSGPSSGPSINNAIYDFATALLTVQGTDLSPTEAQIQTIVVDGIALDSYTADDPATGPDSNGLEQGKYRIKSDGTAIWLRLTDRHKAVLEAKVGSNGRKDGLLSVGSGAWAGLNTPKDLDVRNVPENKQSKVSDDNQPSKQAEEDEQDEQAEEESPKQTEVEQAEEESPKQTEVEQAEEVEEESPELPEAAITRATYHVGTALLTLQGTHLSATTATQAQIQTITVDGLALSSYTADDDATGPDSRGLAKGKYRIANAGTALWLYLTDQHKTTLNGKTGMDSNGLREGLLSVGTGTWAGLDTAKDLAVSGNPEATITGASYNVGTALLTVQGTHLGSATQAQIQTITVDGLALSSYTADGTATGPDSRSLAKGKYRLHSAGTELWLYLTDRHKTTLNGKTGMDSNGLKDGLLSVGTGAWAGLNTAKALAVSGNPAITRASYNVGTALLTVQGTDLGSATQAQIQTIVVDGLALSSYIADATATGPDSRGLAKGKYRLHSAGTALWLKLTDADKATLNGKTGMDSNGLKDGLLSVGTGAWAGLDTAKALAVSGNPPAITSATYNVVTGVLVITGVNLPKAVTGWDFSKLTLVSGDGTKRLTLPPWPFNKGRAEGSAASATSLTITLNSSEFTKAIDILVKNGDSDDTGAYNLEAAAGFAGGRAADTSNNPITVSGRRVAIINNLSYNYRTGVLVIYGSNLPTTVEEWDFSKLTIVSGDGKKKYTLPRHSTVGENRATGSRASRGSLTITLSGTEKAKANAILDTIGAQNANGQYNLEAAAGFVIGSPADTTLNYIIVNNF